jgi:hypothetical protein
MPAFKLSKMFAAALVLLLVAALYMIEFSRVKSAPPSGLPGLDRIKASSDARLWEKFYRVRAKIIDGQRAEFEIPQDLRRLEGETVRLKGAVLFYSNGCYERDGKIAVKSFLLVPTIDIVHSCDIVPEVEMCWRILVELSEEVIVSRAEMIDALAIVSGTFRIDSSRPYDAAFFIDAATCRMLQEDGW